MFRGGSEREDETDIAYVGKDCKLAGTGDL